MEQNDRELNDTFRYSSRFKQKPQKNLLVDKNIDGIHKIMAFFYEKKNSRGTKTQRVDCACYNRIGRTRLLFRAE